jgi:hypothetical protein
LTVFQAKERAPRAVGRIGAWLSGLPEHVRMSAAAASATERVGGMLVALPTSDDESPAARQLDCRTHHERLPHDPVDELVLYVPFFDDRFGALSTLVQRMERPRYASSSKLTRW